MSKCFWCGPRIICGNWCFSVFTAWSQPLWTESKKKAIVHKAAQNCHITLCQRTWREAWWMLAANSLVTWHQNKWVWIRWSPACLVWTCPGHHSDCTEPTEAHGSLSHVFLPVNWVYFGSFSLFSLRVKDRGCCALLITMRHIGICEYGLYKLNLIDWLTWRRECADQAGRGVGFREVRWWHYKNKDEISRSRTGEEFSMIQEKKLLCKTKNVLNLEPSNKELMWRIIYELLEEHQDWYDPCPVWSNMFYLNLLFNLDLKNISTG